MIDLAMIVPSWTISVSVHIRSSPLVMPVMMIVQSFKFRVFKPMPAIPIKKAVDDLYSNLVVLRARSHRPCSGVLHGLSLAHVRAPLISRARVTGGYARFFGDEADRSDNGITARLDGAHYWRDRGKYCEVHRRASRSSRACARRLGSEPRSWRAQVGVCRAAAALKPDVVLELWRSLGADELRPLMRILAERCDSATREELAIVLHQSALKSERLKHLDQEARKTHLQARALDDKPESAPESPVSSSTPPKRDHKLKGAKDSNAAASSPGRKKLRSGRAYGQKPSCSTTGSEDAERAVGEALSSPPSGPVSKVRWLGAQCMSKSCSSCSMPPVPSQVFATVDLLVLIMQLQARSSGSCARARVQSCFTRFSPRLAQDFSSMHRMIATCPQLRCVGRWHRRVCFLVSVTPRCLNSKVIDGPTAARALQYVAREVRTRASAPRPRVRAVARMKSDGCAPFVQSDAGRRRCRERRRTAADGCARR